MAPTTRKAQDVLSPSPQHVSGRHFAAPRKISRFKKTIAAYALTAVLAITGVGIASENYPMFSSPDFVTTTSAPVNLYGEMNAVEQEDTEEPVVEDLEPAKTVEKAPVKAAEPEPEAEAVPEAKAEPVAEPVVETVSEAPVKAVQAPSTLAVPELGVSAPVVPSPLENNALVVPESGTIGSYTNGAPLESNEGTTLMIGHVNYPDGSPGALASLWYAQPGQIISVAGTDGAVHKFSITSVNTYDKRQLPAAVFATTGAKQLALVTCGGPMGWFEGKYTYTQNVVAMATPVK